MEESAGDVEKQQQLLLPAAAAGEKPPGKACSCTSPTATRTLALVVVAAGAAFAAHLAAREEYVLLAVFASQLVSFCVFTSLLALCALPEDDPRVAAPRAWAWARARAAAAQVLLWSFAMALTVAMACWAAQSAPVAVGAALLVFAVAAVLACCAEAVDSLWPAQ